MADLTLSISNLRSIREAEIRIAPIALLIGANERGKTTCATALAALLTGDSDVWPETLKKDGKVLVNRASGMKTATATLAHEGGNASLSWPDGQLQTDGAFVQSSRFGAGLDSLCDMKPKERVAPLYALLKPEPTEEDWQTAFREATMPDGAVDALWKMIVKTGWDQTLVKAQERRGERVRAWEAAAKEEYGSKKAIDWKPEGLTPDLEGADETELQQAVTVARSKLEEGLRGAGASDAERDRLASIAGELDVRQKALDDAETVVQARAGDKVTAEKARAALPAGGKSGGAANLCPCPHCGAETQIVVTGGGLAPGYQLKIPEKGDKGPSKEVLKAIAGADGALSHAIGALSTAQQRVYTASAAVTEAEQATMTLASLKAPSGDADIEWLRGEVAKAESGLDLFRRWTTATESAEFLGYSEKFIAALKPEGVRGKKLMQSLDAFNGGVLADICQKADWPEVMVKPDDKGGLLIYYKAEPFLRGSASAQWRCRVALQIAMATLSHDQVLVIDAADINDKDRRADLIALLADTSIPSLVCMTAMPDQVPDLASLEPPLGATYYITEDGNVVNVADFVAAPEAEEEEPVN